MLMDGLLLFRYLSDDVRCEYKYRVASDVDVTSVKNDV